MVGNLGAAPDQFGDDSQVAVETGHAQRQAGFAVHVGFFDVGPVVKGADDGGPVTLLNGAA